MKQAVHLFKLNAKIIYFFQTLKQNESQILVKVCCVAEKFNDNINKIINDENLSKVLNFNFLLNSLSSNFFMNFKLSSQIAEAFLHN